jgi:hypothetical protein
MSYESSGARFRIPNPFMKRGRQVNVRVGDAVKRGTDALGIEQCGGCKERQQRWNRLLALYGIRNG